MNYFEGCFNMNQAKVRFRELCKKLHPDAGGDAQEFSKMSNQYDKFSPTQQEHTNTYSSYFKESPFTGYESYGSTFNFNRSTRYESSSDSDIETKLKRAKQDNEQLKSELRSQRLLFNTANCELEKSKKKLDKIKKQLAHLINENRILRDEVKSLKENTQSTQSLMQEVKDFIKGVKNDTGI